MFMIQAYLCARPRPRSGEPDHQHTTQQIDNIYILTVSLETAWCGGIFSDANYFPCMSPHRMLIPVEPWEYK